MKRIALILALLASSSLTSAFAQTPGNLLTNGNFEKDANHDNWPDDWPKPEGATWEKDVDGTRFIRLTGLGIDKMPTLYREIHIPSTVKAMQFKYFARAKDVVPGKEKWNDARIIMHFKDKDGHELYPEPEAPTYSGSTKGWSEVDIMFKVPPGTTTMQFIPAMFNAKSGTYDLGDLQLLPISPRAIEARRIGSPINEPVPAVTDLHAGPLPPALKAVGNHLQDSTGKTVRLQGVNVVSLEENPAGEGVLHSIRLVTSQWKVNLIRLPVSDTFWFGKGKTQSDGGTAYRALVDAAIQLAANQGAYTILDLHRSLVPDQSCVTFWNSAAAHYKDHPAVLFGLFNSPSEITWPVWRDGGEVTHNDKMGHTTRFRSPGMQGLVDAVRKTGAKNLLVIGGLDAYDLTGIAGSYALTDRSDGAGIVYDVHVFSWNRDWKGKFLSLTDKYPILIGECGTDSRDPEFMPKGLAQEDPYTWAPDLLGMIAQYHLNWAASSLHPQVEPRLIDTWRDYDPTPFWGGFVRAALAGGKFKCNALR